MKPENGRNPNKIKYFDLHDYVDKIKLDAYTVERMLDTVDNWQKYIEALSKYNDDEIIYFLINSFESEITSSNLIENHIISPRDVHEKKVFYPANKMNNNTIKKLHSIAMADENIVDFRTKPVRVSYIKRDGSEDIFWRGVEPADIEKFMDDFLDIYKSDSPSIIDINPFLKSYLISLLFIRIHPFSDGNGRTGRLIQNLMFTDKVNNLYGTKLVLSPLNTSTRTLLYKPSYAESINNIYFDLEHDSNDEINKWFIFNLNMADEQLNYLFNKLNSNSRFMKQIANEESPETSEKMMNGYKKMKVNRLC